MIQHRTRQARRWPTLLVAGAVSATLAACGGSSGDDETFDDGDVNNDGIVDTPIGEPDASGTQAYDINGDGLEDVDLGLGQYDSNGDGFEDRDVNGDFVVDDSVVEDGVLVGYETDPLTEDRDGTADSDATGEPLEQEPDFIEPSAANPCGSQPDGDAASANFDWNDNCQVSRANQFASSQYTKGVQRVVWCAGFGGNSSASTVEGFADGIFGPNTQQAVEAFQTDAIGASSADGVVGPNTWGALQDALVLLPSATIAAGDGSDFAYDGYTVEGDRCGDEALFYNEVGFVDGEEDLRGWTLADPVGSDQRSPFTIDAP